MNMQQWNPKSLQIWKWTQKEGTDKDTNHGNNRAKSHFPWLITRQVVLYKI